LAGSGFVIADTPQWAISTNAAAAICTTVLVLAIWCADGCLVADFRSDLGSDFVARQASFRTGFQSGFGAFFAPSGGVIAASKWRQDKKKEDEQP